MFHLRACHGGTDEQLDDLVLGSCSGIKQGIHIYIIATTADIFDTIALFS
jgi:hypothetical protein